MKDPTVIYPEGFDVAKAWKGCRDWVEEKGEGSIAASFGADPGCCHCPVCRTDYWAWGSVIKCNCGFVFPTDWWSRYSGGVNDGRKSKASGETSWRMEQYRRNPYYREGFDNPPSDETWIAKDTIDWESLAVTSIENLLPLPSGNCRRCGKSKESDRMNRTTSLCVQCQSNTECAHRCSMMEPTCNAGVSFEELRSKRSDGECLPCYYIEGMTPMECPRFEKKSVQKIKERDEEINRAIERHVLLASTISEVKKENKGRSWSGTKVCPVCSGALHMTHAAYNGHVHGKCETDGCVSWME